jgi:hypothetical protein
VQVHHVPTRVEEIEVCQGCNVASSSYAHCAWQKHAVPIPLKFANFF